MSTRRSAQRTVATAILGAVTPLVVAAGVAGMGMRAAVAAAPTQQVAHRLVATNPLQCVQENLQCARDAASGDNPCDLMPC